MKVIQDAAELNPGPRPVCVAIGVFDGVHLGHQAVLRQTLADASGLNAISVAVTFDRHPSAIVAPHRAPLLIYPLAKKLRVFAALGLDTACVIPFDKPFSQRSGAQFVHDLAGGFQHLKSICVGSGFMFGAGRSGNVDLLEKLGREFDFNVHAVSDVALDGHPISSTRIRDAIRSGNLTAAGRMLGRTYTLSGQVITGRQLGAKLGFPTANLDVTGILSPPAGVYAATAEVAGQTFRAAVNIGYRPTVASGDSALHVEAHLLDFSGGLVGQELELTFQQKLREEKKFSSLEALRAQIAADIAQIRAFAH